MNAAYLCHLIDWYNELLTEYHEALTFRCYRLASQLLNDLTRLHVAIDTGADELSAGL